MKKFLFAIVGLSVLTSCSFKTNEEKARDLIEPKVKARLIEPESYELAQMQLDSCFSNDKRNPQFVIFIINVAKLFSDYKIYTSNAERAESSMTIYSPSFGYQSAHSKHEQEKFKAEMEKAQRKAAAAKEQILQLYKDNKKFLKGLESAKNEFIGWLATLSYRAETAGGKKTMGGAVFFLNKELTEITHSFSEEDLRDLDTFDIDDLNYEFEKEISDILGEE